jgi:hypothetical protein
MTNHIKRSDTPSHKVFNPSQVSDVKLAQCKKDVKLNAVSKENSRGVQVIPTHLANLKDIVFHTHDDLEEEHELDPNYQVQIQDVIWDSTGRKGSHRKHPGNRRLMVIIEMNTIKYRNAKTKSTKSNIIRHVVDVIRQSGGRFIQRSCSSMNGSGTYRDIGSIRARDRVRGLFREDDRRSSTAIRKAKRAKCIHNNVSNLQSTVVVTDELSQKNNLGLNLGDNSSCAAMVVGEGNAYNSNRHCQGSKKEINTLFNPIDPYRLALQNYQQEYDLLQMEYHKLQQLRQQLKYQKISRRSRNVIHPTTNERDSPHVIEPLDLSSCDATIASLDSMEFDDDDNTDLLKIPLLPC